MTRTVFGPGALDELSQTVAAAATGGGPVLVVLSRGAVERPWYGDLLSTLRPHSPALYRHESIHTTEASIAAVMKGARDAGAVVLVAVGGGTVMDATKAASARLAEEWGATPPVVAVPTTPGTGAEVTPFATVWDFGRGRKCSESGRGLAPAAAVVDPELIMSMPRPLIAISALDALVQGVEAAWSTSSTAESIANGLTAIALVAGSYEGALADPADLRAHTCLSLGGLFSGRAIAVSRTTACHALSYPLTLWKDVPHGHAVAVTCGRMLVHNARTSANDCMDPRGPEHVRAVVHRIVVALGALTPAAAARRVDQMIAAGGLAPLEELDVDSEALACETLTYDRAGRNPRRLEPEYLAELLRSPSGLALEGSRC